MDIKQGLSTDIQSNFMGVNRLFVLLYPNQDCTVKRCNSKKYYWPKGIIKSYNVIVNGNNLYDQTINCDVKRYEEIKKLTTGPGNDYTTGCLLDYEYIKNHCRLIAVELSRQKELDAHLKAI